MNILLRLSDLWAFLSYQEAAHVVTGTYLASQKMYTSLYDKYSK
jgi:hypothetical protein